MTNATPALAFYRLKRQLDSPCAAARTAALVAHELITTRGWERWRKMTARELAQEWQIRSQAYTTFIREQVLEWSQNPLQPPEDHNHRQLAYLLSCVEHAGAVAKALLELHDVHRGLESPARPLN